MKTSNKILLGVFVLVLLVLTGIHFALNQRYKNGQFVTTTMQDDKQDEIALRPVKHVRLAGLDNVVIEYADSYRIGVGKEMPPLFKYKLSGDTLLMYMDTLEAVNYKNNSRHVFQEVKLFMPAVTLIEADHSSVTIRGKDDSSGIGDTRIELVESKLSFGNQSPESVSGRYFGDVSIVARQSSEVEFLAKGIHFGTLSCELEKSTFRDNDMGDINKFIIKTDDSSKVEVGGANFKKLLVPGKE